MVDVPVGGGVDLFGFEGLHEALGHGIVIGAAGPAHAGLDAGGFQAGDVVAAGVLNAPVGVVDQARRRTTTRLSGHLQRVQGQARGEMVFQRPADHLAAEGVQHDRQIDEGLGEPHIGDVRHPQPVRRPSASSAAPGSATPASDGRESVVAGRNAACAGIAGCRPASS